MYTPPPEPDEEPPAKPPESRQERLDALASSLLSGLGSQGVQELAKARDQLEQALAEIQEGRFVIQAWVDEEGDCLSLRVRLADGAGGRLISRPAPAGNPHHGEWPYDFPDPG